MTISNNLLDKKLAGMALTFVMTLTACGKQEQQQGFAPQVLPVETQSLKVSRLEESSEFLGSLEAQERVTLAPRVEGRIISIAVKEGERVKRGQIIVQLQENREEAEVNAAVSDVKIRQADVANAQAQVKTAEAEVARVEAQVEQSKADLRRQEAEVALAQTNIDRAKFLVQEGAESKQFLDDRTRDLDAAIAQRDALKQALRASNKALIAAQENVRAALANVERERAGLSQAQARVGVASENLEFNRIVAPIDGIVGDIVPEVGDYVEAGDRLTTITQNNNLELNIAIPIEQARRLKLGLPVAIIGNQGDAEIEGRISFISPTVNSTQQSILAKATFPNNGSLQDEQFVRARVIWSEKPGVLVPTTAISRIAGQNFVFVAEEAEQKGTTTLVARQKVVKLGDIQGQAYQIISGIEAGENLITSGILNLADGIPISSEQLSVKSYNLSPNQSTINN
ncbi:MAG: efflux RND transporter periplasmic adaptor subunit [Xenococcaceae cyanobacterium MO_207.B15]|nr:efflux RND transporter periplasmic adaptor subunit [Xenococcaceae cyanobacterium MO_207.B15]